MCISHSEQGFRKQTGPSLTRGSMWWRGRRGEEERAKGGGARGGRGGAGAGGCIPCTVNIYLKSSFSFPTITVFIMKESNTKLRTTTFKNCLHVPVPFPHRYRTATTSSSESFLVCCNLKVNTCMIYYQSVLETCA